MSKPPKGVKALIDREFARLKSRPRDAEAGIETLSIIDRAAVIETALSLRADDGALRNVFAAADLDPTNPFHWAEIARIVAQLRFGSRKPGRRQRWGPQEYCQLLNDIDHVHHDHPKWSLSKVCEQLVKHHDRYASLKAQTLRRRFQEARDPHKNSLLENILKNRDKNDWLNRHKRPGWRMKASASVRELMLNEIIETIMTGWQKLERK